MKLMKRALVLLLCFLMLTNGPINAFATEGVSDNDVVAETTVSIETIEVCEECGGADAHTETCSFNIKESLFEKAMACTSLEAFELVMMEAPEEDKAALTETELEGLEVHANSLMPVPLPAIEIDEIAEEPVISEIVHVTVNYTNVAPLVDAEE